MVDQARVPGTTFLRTRGRALSVIDLGLAAGSGAWAAVQIQGLPASGTLFFDGDGPGGAAPVAVTAGQAFSIADIVAGKLTYVPKSTGTTASVDLTIVPLAGDGHAGDALSVSLALVAQASLTSKSQTLAGTQNLTLASGAILSVAETAVKWSAASTGAVIDNAGIIESTALDGRAINASGLATGERTIDVYNRAGAVIQAENDAFRINIDIAKGNVHLENAGLILSTVSGQAVDFDAVASTASGQIRIDNLATGVIHAMGADAVRPGENGIVTNAGVINAAGGDGKSDGIDFQLHAGSVTNLAGGLITGQRHGITTSKGVTVVNEAGATIEGRNGSGVGSDGDGKVMNYGTIIGGYAGSGNGDGDGVDIDGYGEVDNWGTILALGAGGVDPQGGGNVSDGVVVTSGYVYNHGGGFIYSAVGGIIANNITNEGRVAGMYAITANGKLINYAFIEASAIGVIATSGTEIINSQGGIIYSRDIGVILAGGSAASSIENHGVISGTIGILAEVDIGRIVNYGTINGTESAVKITSGSAVLIIERGAKFVGSVIGNGNASIELRDGATLEQSTAFASLTVNGSATVTAVNDFRSVRLMDASVLYLAQGASFGDATFDVGFGATTLEIAIGEALPNRIEHFGRDDRIVLLGVTGPGAALTVQGASVLVTDVAGRTATINIPLDPRLHFVTSVDTNGNLQIGAEANPLATPKQTATTGIVGTGAIPMVVGTPQAGGIVDHFRVLALPDHGTLYADAALSIAIARDSDVAATDGQARFYFVPDTDWRGTATFDIVASNLLVESDAARQTIVVRDPNLAPTGSDGLVAAMEDTAFVLSVAHFPFTDSDGDRLAAVRIVTLPVQGLLTLDGTAVVAGQSIAIADIVAGKLTFIGAPDQNGVGYTSLTFQVQDDGGVVAGGVDTDTTARVLTIDVQSVEDAPRLTAIVSPTTFVEGAGSSLGLAVSPFSAVMIDTIETGQMITGLTLDVAGLVDGRNEWLHFDGGTIVLADGESGITQNGFAYAVTVTNAVATIVLNNAAGVSTATAQALIEGIAYQNGIPDTPTAGDRIVTLTSLLDNGGAASTLAPLAATVHVQPINDAPSLIADTARLSFVEGGGNQQGIPVMPFSAVTIDTVEPGQAIVGLTLSVAGLADGRDERLTIDGTTIALIDAESGITAAGLHYAVTVTGAVASVTLTSVAGLTVAAAQALVETIAYQNTNIDAPTAGARIVTLTGITDSGGTANGGIDTTSLAIGATIIVQPVEDAPQLTASVTPVTFVEGVAHGQGIAVAPFASVTIDTLEPGQTITGLTLTVAGLLDSIDEQLRLDGGTIPLVDGGKGITTTGFAYVVTVANAMATVVLTNTLGVSPAVAQALVEGIAYRNGNADAPTAGDRIITLTDLLDSGGAVSAMPPLAATIHVQPVNDAPMLTAATSPTTFVEAAGSGLGAAVVLFSAVTIDMIEPGQTITGLSLSVAGLVDGRDERLRLDDSTIVLADGETGVTTTGLHYAVTVTGTVASVALTSVAGLSVTAAQALIEGIAYRNANADAPTAGERIVTLTGITDSGGIADGGIDTGTLAIAAHVTVVPVNDAPTLTAIATSTTFVEGAAGTQGLAVALFSNVAIDTIEPGQLLTGFRLAVTGLVDGAHETVRIDGAAIALIDGAHGVIDEDLAYAVIVKDGIAGIAVTSAAGMTPTAMAALIDGIAYQNTDIDAPTAGERIVTLTGLTDDGGTANGGVDTPPLSLAATVHVQSVNDAPIVSAVALPVTFVEGIGAAQGAGVPVFSAVLIDTVEPGQTITGLTLTVAGLADGRAEQLTIDDTAIVLVDGAHGLTTSGLTYMVTLTDATASVALTSTAGITATAAEILIGGIAYQNTLIDMLTAGDRIVTLTGISDSGGTLDGGVDTTPLSLATTVHVQSVNDAPIVSAVALPVTFLEGVGTMQGAPMPVFSTVVVDTVEPGQTITGLTFTVAGLADGRAEQLTIDDTAIVLVDGTHGLTASGLTYAVTLTDTTASVTLTSTAGITATAAEILIGAIAYQNTLVDTPTAGDRIVTLTQITDSGGTLDGGVDTTVLSLAATVHVLPVDDAPVAVADIGRTAESALFHGPSVLLNDYDVDGPALAITLIDGQPVTFDTPMRLASGALLTMHADGSYDYDPNHRFDALVSAATATATGAVNSSATDGFTYTLAGGATTSVVMTITGVDGAGDRIVASGGNDILVGQPAIPNYFDLSKGGDVTVTGGSADDAFFVGAALTAADRIDGGGGTNNQMGLQGDYTGSHALVLAEETLKHIATLAVLPGHSYDITSADGTVAAGAMLNVFGTNLGATDDLTFDGSAEKDGTFRMFGGLGTDHLTGGAGNDGFYFGPDRWGTTDWVHGGAGANDQLALDGHYAVTLDARADVEVAVLLPGRSDDPNRFAITIADAFIAAGRTKTIFATQVLTPLLIDGSGEHDGALRVFGGRGADTIIGTDGNDWMFGGAGKDSLTGGKGADVFYYDDAAQSTGSTYDTLVDFTPGEDRIVITGHTPGHVDLVRGGSLSAGSLDIDLATAIGTTLTADHAVWFTPDQGSLAGQAFLIVDANGIAGYQAGEDYVFHVPAGLDVATATAPILG